jgi:biotin-(acetyl-CoA carboxylase) ligase
VLLLSDCPERLAGLAHAGDGREVTVDSLAAGDRALWRALGTGRPPWRGTGRDPDPPGFWSRGLVVAEAPGSQFDALREALAGGLELPGPTACLALTGRGFHGQRGRPWASASGNLHLCTVFPEPGLAAGLLPSLPALPVVALVDAIRALTGLRPGIKWVNDVLVDGRKVGGVLTATQTQGRRVNAVLLGIGLNVATTPLVARTPFAPSVGSLAEAGAGTTWDEAATAVLAALGRRLTVLAAEGPAELLEAYREASVVIGREVCVFAEPGDAGSASAGPRPAPRYRGTVRGIGADLSLLLEGTEAPVASGRLAFAEDVGGRDAPPE